MSTIDDRTSALSLPLPHPQNDLGVDVLRLRTAIIGLDTASASQAEAIVALSAAVIAMQRLLLVNHYL